MIARGLLRFLMRTPWSTAMAVIGMALGVTSIVSVHLVSASISHRLEALVPSTLADYSHYLHRDALASANYVALRKDWRAGRLPTIKHLSPIVDETSQLEGQSIRVLGVDLLANQPSGEFSHTTAAFSWDGVWVDQSLADQLSLPINGIIAAPTGTLVADISIAHDLLGWPATQLSYIGVVLTDAFADTKDYAEKILPGFGAGFPTTKPKLNLSSDWHVISIAEQYPARAFGKSVLFNIAALGSLALLVAWLLIYQVAVSWLRRLWPVFDRLHVLGVEWRQLRLYFLFLIGFIAVLAALLGLLVGWWLANWLMMFAVPGQNISLTLDGWVIFKAVGSAVVVCLFGGAWAFRQAQQQRSKTALPLIITSGLLALAIWCVVAPLTGLIGGFFAIAVLSLAASQLIAPLLTRLRQVAPLIRGSYVLRIGVREALWHPSELSVALAGLALAIATAIGVTLMVDSFRVDFSRMLDHRLKYEVVADGANDTLQALAASNNYAPYANRVQIYRTANIRVGGLAVELNTTRMDAFESARYAFDRRLASGEVLISEQASQALKLGVNDSLTVAGEALTITGIFSSFGDLQPRLVVSDSNPVISRLIDEFKTDGVAFISHDPDALIAAIRQQFPTLELRLQSDIRRIALDVFDQTFAITTVLIIIALLVATLSVYIAVTTLRLNRQTPGRLLTTLGFTRTEQWLMNLALGLGLGVVAIMIAAPLGILFGWILCDVINPRAFGWTIELQLSAQPLVRACAWGMIAAITAGLLQGGSREEGAFGAR